MKKTTVYLKDQQLKKLKECISPPLSRSDIIRLAVDRYIYEYNKDLRELAREIDYADIRGSKLITLDEVLKMLYITKQEFMKKYYHKVHMLSHPITNGGGYKEEEDRFFENEIKYIAFTLKYHKNHKYEYFPK